MGAGGDVKEENKKLKEKIEKEMQPIIDKLKKENELKTKNEEKLKKQINKLKEIELTPEEIQQLMTDNANMKDEIFSLKKDIELAKGINLKYKYYCMNLLSEIEKLKLVCAQYQLLLLSQNQKLLNTKFNNNMLHSWRTQICNIIDNDPSTDINSFNNSFNNSVNKNYNCNSNNINRINNNFNNNKDRISTIVFSFENKTKCPIVIFPKSRLMDIFSLVSFQIGNSAYSDINNLIFHHNGVDITKQFLNNDEVSCLNLSYPSPIIEVIRKKNVVNKHC